MRTGLGIAVFLVAAAVAAQFGETIEVRLHQLEVIVETKDGVPVTSLTKDDFIVRQDGEVQNVTNFSINVEEVEETVGVRASSPAPASQPEVKKREDRRYVFFVDQVPMHDDARKDFLRQTSALLNAMTDGDQAMVVTPGGKKQVALYFTSDTKELQKSLEYLTAHMMRLTDMAVMADGPKPAGWVDTGDPINTEDPYFRRGDCGASLTVCSENRLAALKVVLRSLAAVPGRKALVMMSNRITSAPDWKLGGSTDSKILLDHGKNLKPLVQEVARLAAENNVMIYAIEPYEAGDEALGGATATQALRDGIAPVSGGRGPLNALTLGEAGVLDAFREMASITGGKAFASTREFDDLFGKIVSDQSFYYSLAFPDRGKRGQAHRVTVEVRNRPELVVRSRKSVVTKTQHDETRDKALSALLQAKPGNELGIRVTIQPLKKAGRKIDIPVTVRVPLGRLTMIRQGDSYRGSFTVYVAAQDSEKLEIGDANSKNTQDVVVPVRDWEKAQRSHFTYETALRVQPGNYRLAVGVTDGASAETGFQTFDVNAVRGAGT